MGLWDLDAERFHPGGVEGGQVGTGSDRESVVV